MNNLNHTNSDFETGNVSDVLREMQAEVESPKKSSIASANRSEGISKNPAPQTNPALSYGEYSILSIRVFEQINDYMGDFCNSLKSINSNFAYYADWFWKNARQIAQKSEKKSFQNRNSMNL